jgi:hypothetical protein
MHVCSTDQEDASYIILYFTILDVFEEYFGYHVVPWG